MNIPVYIVPKPSDIAMSMINQSGLLFGSLWVTLKFTMLAFACAVIIGTLVAFVFVQSRVLEACFMPYAILFQVTPIVAIAPLVIIWIQNTTLALVVCAMLVAIFPILTNTTLYRPEDLPASFREERGGLSGAPLTDLSTGVIRRFYTLTKGKIPIIGVGGILSANDAYTKIRAGASLVQLYSGLIFEGPNLIRKINKDLVKYLRADGFGHIREAIGADHR
jgi:dihydroorotate dehydrogenase